jgi:acyl-CoA synthetase (AMP-forming)/AMP-acid ligase II
MRMPEGPTWRSPFPDVQVTPALIDDEVLGALDRRPGGAAVVEAATGRTLTGGQLADGARRLAAGLRARGAGLGDTLAIIAANSATTQWCCTGVSPPAWPSPRPTRR